MLISMTYTDYTTGENTPVSYWDELEAKTTLEEVAHVLNYFYPNEGFVPGSFTGKLLSAIEAADPQNLALMSRAFPEYVQLMSLAKNREDGIEYIRGLLAAKRSNF